VGKDYNSMNNVEDILNRHLLNIIQSNNITVVYDNVHSDEAFYDANTKTPHIPSQVNNMDAYFDSLHELGHAVLGHGVPLNWDEEARMEKEAWEFVKTHSIVPVSTEKINIWEKQRIKGSNE